MEVVIIEVGDGINTKGLSIAGQKWISDIKGPLIVGVLTDYLQFWDMTSVWQLQPEVEDKHCPFCDQEDETIDHLLEFCLKSKPASPSSTLQEGATMTATYIMLFFTAYFRRIGLHRYMIHHFADAQRESHAHAFQTPMYFGLQKCPLAGRPQVSLVCQAWESHDLENGRGDGPQARRRFRTEPCGNTAEPTGLVDGEAGGETLQGVHPDAGARGGARLQPDAVDEGLAASGAPGGLQRRGGARQRRAKKARLLQLLGRRAGPGAGWHRRRRARRRRRGHLRHGLRWRPPAQGRFRVVLVPPDSGWTFQFQHGDASALQ
ncbi:hypothetical protein ACJX0J_019199, partial [Zea mays]